MVILSELVIEGSKGKPPGTEDPDIGALPAVSAAGHTGIQEGWAGTGGTSGTKC